MSVISNRKRPRGLSGSFDGRSGGVLSKSSNISTSTIPLQFKSSGFNSSSSSGKDSSPGHKMNMELGNVSGTTLESSNSSIKLNNNRQMKPTDFGDINDIYIIEDDDDDYMNGKIDEVDENDHDLSMERRDTFGNDLVGEDDDDVIIVEERQLNPQERFEGSHRSKRINSDSLLFDHEAFAAYNMFNVHSDSKEQSNTEVGKMIGGVKKQRTNSLPQLPQARCIYNKIPRNYILQHSKLGNIRTNVIPHQLNLPPCDDKEGHYIIKANDLFANRFVIVRLLGQGTFGKVVECYDKVNREHVAIKIIRNVPKYRDAAKIELRILSTLKKFDHENANHCIHLRECFDYRNHVCIVTDLLKISLYDFLEKNKFIPFPGSHIQAISKQLIRSVTFFHDLKLIHTDLKPENILLHDDSFFKKALHSSTIIDAYMHLSSDSNTKRPPKFSRILKDPLIQIIDFGSAIFDDEYHSSIVSTRHYRAPEIVLGVGWSFPCDIWSVGCILIELVIGEPLFKTHDNLEHLAMIEKVCGTQIDKSMVRLSKERSNECGVKYFRGEYFGDNEFEGLSDDEVVIDGETSEMNSLSLIFPSETTPSKFVKSVEQLSRIDIFVSSRIGLDINFDFSLSYNYQKNQHLIDFGNFTFWWFFIDLLKKLFIIDPNERLTAQEALEHPWFNLGIEDEGTT